MIVGYSHPQYAASWREFGEPYELPLCGGWILVRDIAGFPYQDAMGCYPIFACNEWSQLHKDLETLERELVSLALVTDPFGAYDEAYLHQCFPNVTKQFKEHFVVDLDLPPEKVVSKHHRYYARKALQNVQVEICHEPYEYLDEWIALYDHLVARHDIEGIQAFSRTAFERQLQIPGIVMFRALTAGTTVGAHLWFVQGDVAHSHLAAFNSSGYDLMASYALYWRAIDYFSDTMRWLNLGAGAGVQANSTDGLSRFKRGWASNTRTAYFCGRIFDERKYIEIAQARGVDEKAGYFPAYRQGEFH